MIDRCKCRKNSKSNPFEQLGFSNIIHRIIIFCFCCYSLIHFEKNQFFFKIEVIVDEKLEQVLMRAGAGSG